jgi:hemerythrin
MRQELWSAEMELGIPEVDESHQALLEELARLLAAPDEGFAAAYPALVARIEQDFSAEEDAMEKIAFPGLREHREQHARVLSGLHHVAPRVIDGDVAAGRKVIELLPQWFIFHVSTMDTIMAVALRLANAA